MPKLLVRRSGGAHFVGCRKHGPIPGSRIPETRAQPLHSTKIVMRLVVTGIAAVGLFTAAAAPVGPQPVQPDHSGHVSAPAARVGMVEGTVVLGAAAESPPAMISPYARRRYSPPAAARGPSSQFGDVVIYVLADGSTSAPSGTRATVAQRNQTITPHVTAVQVGTRVDFPNEDEVFHNLFSLSSAQRFNLGRYPQGESRSQHFPRAGVIRLFCDIHSEMSGVILVLDTPHFTHPDANGRFRIANVPEGRHRVVAWHESAGADTIDVVVGSNGASVVNFSLGG